MSGMRIAFFGSSLVSAYWNGAARYYRLVVDPASITTLEVDGTESRLLALNDLCDRFKAATT